MERPKTFKTKVLRTEVARRTVTVALKGCNGIRFLVPPSRPHIWRSRGSFAAGRHGNLPQLSGGWSSTLGLCHCMGHFLAPVVVSTTVLSGNAVKNVKVIGALAGIGNINTCKCTRVTGCVVLRTTGWHYFLSSDVYLHRTVSS